MVNTCKTTQIRTFETDVAVSTFLEGTLDDWPAVIQDGVYAALERLAQSVQLPLAIVGSRCDVDPDKAEDEPGRFFIHVVASEIVVADDRTLSPGSVMPKGLI